MTTRSTWVRRSVCRKRIRCAILSSLVTLGLATSSAVMAADWYVAVPGDDTNACDSLASPCRNIQAAVNKAASGDTIHVEAGNYVETVTISEDLTVQGDGAQTTIVNGEAADSVFTISSGTAVTLSGLRITNGTAGSGGGVFSETNTDLTLADSIVTGNSADSSSGGGGIFVDDDSSLTVVGSTVSDNTTVGSGGGIMIGESTFSLTESVVSGNTATRFGGGMNLDDSTGTLNRVTISGNSAGDGGAIYHFFKGRLTLTESTVIGNTADAFGGGLWLCTEETLIERSTLRSNIADRDGGGIFMECGPVTLVNSTISRNKGTSEFPGGSDGGGVFNAGNDPVTLINSTLTRNMADRGGGLSFQHYVLRNTILAGNIAATAPDCTELTSEGFNLIGSTSGCDVEGDTTGNIIGVDPLLGPLQDNGGPTETHALLPGSPAIDAGNPVLGCTDADDAPLTTDQRGEKRPVRKECDIGAYERQKKEDKKKKIKDK